MIDIFTKYAWVKPFENKKTETVFHDFIELVNGSKGRPIKLWADQGK